MKLSSDAKAESHAASTAGTGVVGVTAAGDIAEGGAVPVPRRTQPPSAGGSCVVAETLVAVLLIVYSSSIGSCSSERVNRILLVVTAPRLPFIVLILMSFARIGTLRGTIGLVIVICSEDFDVREQE